MHRHASIDDAIQRPVDGPWVVERGSSFSSLLVGVGQAGASVIFDTEGAEAYTKNGHRISDITVSFHLIRQMWKGMRG